MEIKDVNKVINKYEELLTQANRQLILLSVVNEELKEELGTLKKQVNDQEKS